MLTFRIADVVIGLRLDFRIGVTKPFVPFLTEGEPDYVIDIFEAARLPDRQGQTIYHGECFDVVADGSKRMRYFHELTHKDRPYGAGIYDWKHRCAQITYLPEGRQFLNESGNCFFHLAWESMLLHENRFILHACCVWTQIGGILFSGPSGIGKSTQGDLWCQYEDARIINGDRSILYKEGNVWYACGSPYAGSSKYYVNEKMPFHVIVMLQQADACRIRRLKLSEAFQKMYVQLTVNDWDTGYVNRLCELAEQLAAEVPVYELACTPDRRAVDVLKSTMEGGRLP